MAKCEVIDLTLSDGDFIQAIHSFLYQASVYYIHQVLLHQLSSTTTEIISPDLCVYVTTVVLRSQPDS